MQEGDAGLGIPPGAHPAFHRDRCIARRLAGQDCPDVDRVPVHQPSVIIALDGVAIVRQGSSSSTLRRLCKTAPSLVAMDKIGGLRGGPGEVLSLGWITAPWFALSIALSQSPEPRLGSTPTKY